MSTQQIGEFSVTAVSDGVLYSNHDVVLGVAKDDSAQLTGVPYGQPLPLDVNSFLIRHRGKLILSDAGTGQGLQPVQKNLGKLPENLRALGAPPEAIDIIMLTHLTIEKHIIVAIAKIETLPVVVGTVTRIRMEQLGAH